MPHPEPFYEHTQSANFPEVQEDTEQFWEDLKQDLKKLEAIIHTPEPVDEEWKDKWELAA